MTRSTLFQRAVAVVSALGLVLAAFLAVATTANGPAQAAPSQAPSQQPTTVLFLSVTPRNSPITTAILFCEPPGGLHPSPAEACAALAAVDGDFTKLPGREGVVCADIYDPVLATAFGWWKGRLVWFRYTYPNMCELYGATGPVFPTDIMRPIPTSTSTPRPTVTATIAPPPPTQPCPRPTITWLPPGPTVTRPPGPTVTGPPGPTVTSPPDTGDPPETTIPDGTTIPDCPILD